MKKVLALILVGIMLFSFTACTKPAPAAPAAADSGAAAPAPAKFKIAIYTNTVGQNEEEFRSGEAAQKKYPDMVVTQTMPENFMKEQETLISTALGMVSDPDVKVFIMNQAVQGAAATFDKIREVRPDVLICAMTPGETDVIAAKADIVMQPDEAAMGYTIPAQAQKLGAKTFVHYSFPRHMSYPLLAARREVFKTECEKLGMKFVDATAPDPTGDAGIPGAQQFITEDIPRKVAEFGKDTNFFSTNCAMQEPLIKTALAQGAIVAQQCCPSPFHGYPGALGIQIPPEKAGDVDYIIQQITEKIDAAGGKGRFSTWPIPISMLMTAACVDYGKLYAEGKTNGKNDKETLIKCFNDQLNGKTVTFNTYTAKDKDGKDVTQDNFYLILADFITF